MGDCVILPVGPLYYNGEYAMSTARNLIKRLYRKYKSMKSEKDFPKSAQEASMKAKAKYKKESSEMRAAREPDIDFYSDIVPMDDFPGSEKIPENKAKRYLRKSREGKVSKEDIDDRINDKLEDLYSERKIKVGNKNSRKGVRSRSKVDLDDDIPY